MRPDFDPSILSRDDFDIADRIVGFYGLYCPDVSIMPNGEPYLYRWVVVDVGPKQPRIYFHIQVADDPREELHDHPWDNMSVILAGGYNEILDPDPKHPLTRGPGGFVRSKGDVIFRRANWAHRLLMAGHPYTMTLFSTGPKIRDWGYWFPDGWHHNRRHNTLLDDGTRIFKEEM